MLKQVRRMAVLLTVLVGACATLPDTAEPPVPARPGETPPARTPEPPREAPLRIGVIVSSTGSAVLTQYADLVLDGARVAAEAAGTTRRAVELVVRDDGGTQAGAERAVRELEQAGVRAIVGPLMDEALAAAARARSNESIVLISPTAVADQGARNAYALNVVDTRGAAALGTYARRYGRVGVLYARSPETERQARAFIEAYGTGRGSVIEAPFSPGAANVAQQLGRLRDARIDALYFPAGERDIQIVLPQLDHAGLTAVQMLGNEAWVSDAARGAPQRVLDGAIIATPLLQESRDVAWSEFVQRYETMYRRSLGNPVPALGYDATTLAVRALTSREADVADFRGATGVLSLRAGTVTRRPFLVRLEDGRMIPIN